MANSPGATPPTEALPL
ncbi:hypothetical protein D018_3810A, partial [Vibrio parahaemolyticus VP2007-007]